MAALDGGETEAKEGVRFQVIKQQRFDRTRPPDGSPMFSPAQQHIEAAPRPSQESEEVLALCSVPETLPVSTAVMRCSESPGRSPPATQ